MFRATVKSLIFLYLLASCQAYAQDRTRSVVTIYVSTKDPNRSKLGSGFSVAPGAIATAYHVIEGALAIQIHLPGVTGFVDAKIRNYDPQNDLALLESSRINIPPLNLDDRIPAVNEDLFMVGSPAGMPGQTYSVRLVQSRLVPFATFNDTDGKALFRNPPATSVLQIAGIIYGGISGGPLLDKNGSVIAILSGSLTEGGSYGWAIPVRALNAILTLPAMNVAPQQISAWPPIPLVSSRLRSTEYFVRKDNGTFATVERFTPITNRLQAINQSISIGFLRMEMQSHAIAINAVLTTPRMAGLGPATAEELNRFIGFEATSFSINLGKYKKLRTDLATRWQLDRDLRGVISKLSSTISRPDLDKSSVERIQRAVNAIASGDPTLATSTYEEINGVDTVGLLRALDAVTARSQLRFSTIEEAEQFSVDLQKCVDELQHYDFTSRFSDWSIKEHDFFERAASLLRQYEGVIVYVPE